MPDNNDIYSVHSNQEVGLEKYRHYSNDAEKYSLNFILFLSLKILGHLLSVIYEVYIIIENKCWDINYHFKKEM